MACLTVRAVQVFCAISRLGRLIGFIWKAPGVKCHLDAAGVASACRALLEQISMSDVVVLNKFGKLEGLGEGLAPAFELAISAGKPVLTTVSARHRNAWRTFAPDTSFLPADKVALQNWWRAICVPLRRPPRAPHAHPGRG